MIVFTLISLIVNLDL